MSAFVVCDATGVPLSVGTLVANPLPAGYVAVPISDADFDAIRQGLKRPDVNGVLVDTGQAARQASAADRQTRFAAVQVKAQAVLDANGTGTTFTAAQLQQIVAALVLDRLG